MTPFSEGGRVDLDCLERLTVAILDAGARGVVACDYWRAHVSRRSRTARTSFQSALGSALIAERNCWSVREPMTPEPRIARHEALAAVPGILGSLAVVPYYVRPSETAIVSHFQLVAERSPVPLTIYNIPYRTGRGLGADALLELAATDNIIGLKQAVGGIDVDTLTVLRDAPSGFAVLGGDDPYLLPVVLMGGAGAIAASAHICTTRFVSLVEDGLAGRLAPARGHAEALLPLVTALFAEPSPAVIKSVLHAQGRIPTPDVRMPLAKASAGALNRGTAVLSQGLLDPI